MPRFRCTAPGCGVERNRALPPASCPDKSRCKWVTVQDNTLTMPLPVAPAAPHPPAAQPATAPAAPPSATPVIPPAPAGAAVLALTIGGETVAVARPVTLGRNGDVMVERFRTDIRVSREHCRLELPADQPGGAWRVVALSLQPCVLAGRALRQGESMDVPHGVSELVLGERFVVRLTLTSADTPQPTAGGALDRLLAGGKP